VRAEQRIPQLPSDVQLALFRIAQEGLRNVVEHADAGAATVTLGVSNDRLSMRICDDGQGFDASTALLGSTGLGLASIQERAVQAGGRVTISSRPDDGTCIELTVPVPDGNVRSGYHHGDPLAKAVKEATG